MMRARGSLRLGLAMSSTVATFAQGRMCFNVGPLSVRRIKATQEGEHLRVCP